MKKQYNKKLKIFTYKVNDKLWLQKRVYRKGENKKLSARKTDPWTVIKVCPNGVNYKKVDDKVGKTQIVHHNKLRPVKSNEMHTPGVIDIGTKTESEFDDAEIPENLHARSDSDTVKNYTTTCTKRK